MTASASGVCYKTTRGLPRGEGPVVGLWSQWPVGWGVGFAGKIHPVWILSVV